MDLWGFILLVLGLVLLTFGADIFVEGASSVARRLSISPLIIGLTVVAVGTSAPELAVNLTAALENKPSVAVGNVLGSNILNVLGVLGVCAIFAPLAVSRQLVRQDVPVMIGSAVALLAFAYNGVIGRIEGAILVGLLLVYTFALIRISRKTKEEHRLAPQDVPPKQRRLALDVLRIVGGIAMLVVGSRWLVASAVDLARTLGLSDLVIGLTVVAIGTSLPEAATSVVATLKGEREMAVGNVIGSNIYNVLAVVGLTAVITPIPVDSSALHFDIPVVLATSIACLPIFFTEHRIDRWEGALFFGYYLAYVGYLILDAQQHEMVPMFSNVMLFFVAPLTAVTLLVFVWRQIRGRAPPAPPEA